MQVIKITKYHKNHNFIKTVKSRFTSIGMFTILRGKLTFSNNQNNY